MSQDRGSGDESNQHEVIGMERQGGRVDTPVFAIAAGISVVFVLVGVLFQDDLATVVGDVLSWVLENLGWLFGLSTPNTEAAAATAMEWTYFHWALHAWALYAVVGLALGYFCFRKGLPNLISSAFHPLLGDRVNGLIGKAIDILAIFATMFGSATSLGLGALQIGSGLNFVWDVEATTGLAVVIIALLTLAFVLSAVSGVGKGVEFLSNFNMLVAGP